MVGHDDLVSEERTPAPSGEDATTDDATGADATGAVPPTDGPGQLATPRPAPPPQAYTARAAIARDKGLPGLYISGGEDPDLQRTVEGERRYIRLLVAMVVGIVLGGFVLGIIGVIVGELLGV
jgi:hypothetical protein